MHKHLLRYPFSDPRIRLVEGFREYDGVLGDTPGTPHKGIDYVLFEEGTYHSFDVYTMHAGMAFQGVSESWGAYVLVYADPIENKLYRTVYAHLDDIPSTIPQATLLEGEHAFRNPDGIRLQTGTYVGRAGISGWTNDLIQLHIELHDITEMSEDETRVKPLKLDPYGLNERASSGLYPQPGIPLSHLEHAWTSDAPPFASALSS